MSETVTIYATNNTPPGDPVSGVYVSIHNNATKALLQSGFSDAAGAVVFPNVDETLNSGVFELRIAAGHPASVSGGSVQTVTVLPAPAVPNAFDVVVTADGLMASQNPRLCRCQGYFRDITGRARRSLSIKFSEYDLHEVEYDSGAVLGTYGVIPSGLTVTTDTNGYAVVELYRGVEYLVHMEGFEDQSRVVQVPDSGSAGLVDILFPVMWSVFYFDNAVQILPSSAPTLAVGVGATTDLTTVAYLRSGAVADGDQVIFTSTDDSIVTVGYSAGTGEMTVTGVSAGTTTIVPTRAVSDSGGVRSSPTNPVVAPITVTVS